MWNVGKYLLTSIQTRASGAKDLSGQKINQLKSCLVSFRQYHLFILIKADKKKANNFLVLWVDIRAIVPQVKERWHEFFYSCNTGNFI